VLQANHGALNWSGQSASLLRGRRLQVDPVSLVLTGQEARTVRAAILKAEHGSLSSVGQGAGLFFDRRLQALTGILGAAGQDAPLRATRHLFAEYALFTHEEENHGLFVDRRLRIDPVELSLDDLEHGLYQSRVLQAAHGAFSYLLQSAHFPFGSLEVDILLFGDCEPILLEGSSDLVELHGDTLQIELEGD
jgi:hypothetical protein